MTAQIIRLFVWCFASSLSFYTHMDASSLLVKDWIFFNYTQTIWLLSKVGSLAWYKKRDKLKIYLVLSLKIRVILTCCQAFWQCKHSVFRFAFKLHLCLMAMSAERAGQIFSILPAMMRSPYEKFPSNTKNPKQYKIIN